jgi:hypothetical protein
MRYNFLFILILVALALTIISSVLRFKKLSKKNRIDAKATLISHTEAIRNLPEYKKAKSIYRLLLSLCFVFLATSLVSCTILSSRPVIADYEKNEQNDRDILLCLDVSGSMYEADAAALGVFADMVDELQGQRIGISIFGTHHAQILPLNNDYEATKDFIKNLAKYDSSATSTYDSYPMLDRYSGAVGGMTNVLEGVVGCVQDFTKLDEKRSRSLIIITDNYDNTGFGDEETGRHDGESIHKALNLAKRYGIVAYGFNPADWSSEGNESTYVTNASFKNAVLDTGGSYYALNAFIEPWDYDKETYEEYNTRRGAISDSAKAKEVVTRILEEDAAKHQTEGSLVLKDRPAVFLIVGIVSIICFALTVWRLRL